MKNKLYAYYAQTGYGSGMVKLPPEGRRVLLRITRPHPSVPGLWACEVTCADDVNWKPEWVSLAQLEEVKG